MFFTEKKLVRRMEELSVKRYFHRECIAPFAAMEGKLSEDESNVSLPEFVPEQEFGLNEFFVGRDRYLWVQKTVKLPEQKLQSS